MLSLNASYLTGNTFGLQGCLNQLRIPRIVFEMKNSQWGNHG
jgi:hypothetical protein